MQNCIKYFNKPFNCTIDGILLNVSLKVHVDKGWLSNLCSVPCVDQQEATIYILNRLENKQIHVFNNEKIHTKCR